MSIMAPPWPPVCTGGRTLGFTTPPTCSSGPRSCAPRTPGGSGEVLGVDVLQELPELLDLLLLVVADDDGGLGQDLLVGEDGDVHPDGESDGVTGAGRDLIGAPILVHLDHREERAVLQLGDDD